MLFEYEVLSLHNTGDGNQRNYTWKSNRHGHVGAHHEIAEALNERGAKGWHVAAFTSDGRFGNSIIMQRQLTEEQSPVPASSAPVERERIVTAPPVDLSGVQREISQMRQLMAQSEKQRSKQLEAITGLINFQVGQGMEQMGQALQAVANIPQPQPVLFPTSMPSSLDERSIRLLQDCLASSVRQGFESVVHAQREEREQSVSLAWYHRFTTFWARIFTLRPISGRQPVRI